MTQTVVEPFLPLVSPVVEPVILPNGEVPIPPALEPPFPSGVDSALLGGPEIDESISTASNSDNI